MNGKDTREDMCKCPLGTFFKDIERTFGEKSKFSDHITQSRIEVLKAIRSLVDERIEVLDKKKVKTNRRKMKNIKVK